MLTVLAVALPLLLGCGAAKKQREAPPTPTAAAKRATPVRTCPALPAAPAHPSRLGDDVVPVEYDVRLHVDPEREDFRGATTIDVQIRRPVNTIWLHGVGLLVSHAELLTDDGARTATIARREEYGFLGLEFDADLQPGPARIHIEYEARMGEDAGAFRRTIGSSFHRADFVFSMFEPMDARRVFPCFDEPRFKVPWQLSLIIPSRTRAFSNTRPVEESELPDGTKHVRFAKTRPLPSFLVAFAVGPFDAVEVSGAPARTRLLVRSGKRTSAQNAAEATAKMFQHVQQLIGAPIPYPKHDLVFVPGFRWGGMEHPGLIAVREGFMPSTYGLGRRWASSTIAHELAHLWFGDLVTIAWWDDIWLSEGLADWASSDFSDYALAAPDASWRARRQFYELMRQDAIFALPPIRPQVATPADVDALFGLDSGSKCGRSWQKAPLVLHMIEQFVGESSFRAGLLGYLRTYSDSTATTADFSTAMSRGVGMDLCDVVSTYVGQKGIPVVRAQLDCGVEGVQVVLSQRPDRREHPVVSGADKPRLWSIPVCIRYPEGEHCEILSTAEAAFHLPVDACPSWIHPNRNDDGYYWYELAPADLENLVAHGVNDLSARELVGIAHNLRASYERGAMVKDRALATIRSLMNARELDGHQQLHAELGWVFHQIKSP